MTDLSKQTCAIYDRNAAGWDAQRNRTLFERAWLERTLQDVPPGGAVLDLGCGAGAPIGAYLCDRGFDVTGLDFAPAMLRLFAQRLPQARAVLADMRVLDLGCRFDAIIGWDSFFHLTMDEQRAALPRIAGHLAPGGRLVLTVGPEAGEAIGSVEGEAVYRASLALDEYRRVLADAGAEIAAFNPEDPDAQGRTLLLARRRAGA